MHRPPLLRITALLLLALALHGVAAAFSWTPFAFPPGDQGYTLEIATDGGVTRIDLDVRDRGGRYDVTTTTTTEAIGVHPEAISDAMFGGGAMLGFGPMMLFGPAFFMLPMLLGQEDIRVMAAPMRILGIGTLHMDREEKVAGRTCVVIRLALDAGETVEFAVADGVPIPCFARWGTGRDAIEARLIDVR
jgi:hypothetical protein